MNKNNYSIPLRFSKILAGEDLSRCGEKESIDKHLELIITTCPGEHKYDPNFGCEIWDLDFVSVVAKRTWEKTFREHIVQSIARYEKRIVNIDIDVEFSDVLRTYPLSKVSAIKKKVTIVIKATLISSGEQCAFGYSLYMGPLSTD